MIGKRRKHLFVDSNVQGAIIKRVLFYWCACLMFVTLPIILTMTLSDPSVYWFEHIPAVGARFWPIYLVMLILLPFLIRDALAMSNRFCGPVSRMMHGLKEFNENGEFETIRFRDSDFWQPMANALNNALTKASKSDAVK